MDSLGTVEEIMKVAEDNADAMRRGDTGFLEAGISDDFLGISPSGLEMTKQEWLAGHDPRNFKYSDLRLQDKRIRIYGSCVAILTARQLSHAKFQGHEVEGDFRLTEVFANQNGCWLLVSLQLSPIQRQGF